MRSFFRVLVDTAKSIDPGFEVPGLAPSFIILPGSISSRSSLMSSSELFFDISIPASSNFSSMRFCKSPRLSSICVSTGAKGRRNCRRLSNISFSVELSSSLTEPSCCSSIFVASASGSQRNSSTVISPFEGIRPSSSKTPSLQFKIPESTSRVCFPAALPSSSTSGTSFPASPVHWVSRMRLFSMEWSTSAISHIFSLSWATVKVASASTSYTPILSPRLSILMSGDGSFPVNTANFTRNVSLGGGVPGSKISLIPL
mmetsp:Transcript_27768/g.36399  ORF Transcript_27768/g.36399 Transcript_27768/m.36399 type:complete len:258 (-) Transcript_27768:50-823(-)